MTYATRLTQATADRGRLCVGIDPMPSVLDAWGLSRDVAGLEACARGIVEALGDRVAVFKPQSAFFEAYGSAGVAVLERLLRDIRAAGALSLLDVKRGDIGSSMAGYAAAHLGEHVVRAVLAELQQTALRGKALAHNSLVLAHAGVSQRGGAALGRGGGKVGGVVLHGLALEPVRLLVQLCRALLGGGHYGGGEAFQLALFFLHVACLLIS